jgi:hypothetical protein
VSEWNPKIPTAQQQKQQQATTSKEQEGQTVENAIKRSNGKKA